MFWNFARINPGRLKVKTGYFFEFNKNKINWGLILFLFVYLFKKLINKLNKYMFLIYLFIKKSKNLGRTS